MYRSRRLIGGTDPRFRRARHRRRLGRRLAQRNRLGRHEFLGCLRGRPRGRLRLTIEPRSKISPPHTPQGSARSSAAARHWRRIGQVHAERLGPLEVGRGLGEPQVGIADMTRQRWQSRSGDRQCRHVLFTCFLVWWLSFFGDPDQVGRFFTQKLWPRILVTSGPWPSGENRAGYLEWAPIHGRVSRGGDAVLTRGRRRGGVTGGMGDTALAHAAATPTPNMLLSIIVATLLSSCPLRCQQSASRMRSRG